MMSDPLHLKYRPANFGEVVGQKAVVTALEQIIKRKGAQAFLFCGPSGCGKTTLARITAAEFGCKDKDILEIDAATYTGIDAMRSIQDTLQYKPFGGSSHRAVIIDEAHRLSRSAWDSLLKVVEEPPEHLTWFFCTTEAIKVPDTIKTRCASFTLQPVKDDDILALVSEISDLEKITISESIADLVVREAQGSPRQALVNLALCRDLKTKQEAAQVLRSAIDSAPTLELCQLIIKGRGSWANAKAVIDKLQDENPEEVRAGVCRYMQKALAGTSDAQEACRLATIAAKFSGQTYNPAEGKLPLLLSVLDVLTGD